MTDELIRAGRAARPVPALTPAGPLHRRLLHGVAGALAGVGGLVLPVDCAGCGRPDVALCAACRAGLRGPPRRVPLSAWPTGPPAWAGTVYAGSTRRLVVAWKDHGRHDLTGALGTVLANAVLANTLPAGARLAASSAASSEHPFGWLRPEAERPPEALGGRTDWSQSVVLVPVPASRAARRRRGEALVTRLALAAARRLRRRGIDVRVLSALRLARRVEDQSGLDRRGRLANLDRAMRVRPTAVRCVSGRRCVVVDDILTTGVTVREACRVLEAAGGIVTGVAACCATPLLGGLSGGAYLH